MPGNEAECKIYGGWVKSPAQFNPYLDQSSILGECRGHLYFALSSPDCLWHISFKRYSPFRLEVLENRIQFKIATLTCKTLATCPTISTISPSIPAVTGSPFFNPATSPCTIYVYWFWSAHLQLHLSCIRDTPHVRHAFSNRTYFRVCSQFWLSFIQRAARVAGEKKKIEVRITIRPKSANKYVGWPNEHHSLLKFLVTSQLLSHSLKLPCSLRSYCYRII